MPIEVLRLNLITKSVYLFVSTKYGVKAEQDGLEKML